MEFDTFKIDMQRVRETLPNHGTAVLFKKNINGKTICYIECWIREPSLSEMEPMNYEKDFEMIKDWQRQIVGEALDEFYTEQVGHEWRIYLKRIPLEFTHASEEDIKNYLG
jgi:hypothetical protein